MIKLKNTLAALAILNLSACSQWNSPLVDLVDCDTCIHQVKAYAGDTLPKEQLAVLSGSSPIWVAAIDSKEEGYKPIFDVMYKQYDINLLPGKHEVIVATNAKAIKSPYSIKLNLDFRAGHSYQMAPDFSNGIKYSVKVVEKLNNKTVNEYVFDDLLLR